MLCHCAMRRTETPVPAIHGRPPRISGRREIRLPISVTVAIDFKYNSSGKMAIRRALFIAQRDRRVHRHRPPRRDVTGRERYRKTKAGDRRERRRVGRGHAVEQLRQQAGKGERAGHSGDQARDRQTRALRQDHTQHIAPLGAQRGDALRMILAQGARLAIAGLIAGMAGAFAITRLLAKLLYGVTPTDPATFAAVACLGLAVALAACYIPARRAVAVDPTVALRYE